MAYRTTIVLSQELRRALAKRARETGRSVSDLLREGARRILSDPSESRQKDPLFSDWSVYSGESPPSLARDHDEFLYGDDDDLR